MISTGISGLTNDGLPAVVFIYMKMPVMAVIAFVVFVFHQNLKFPPNKFIE